MLELLKRLLPMEAADAEKHETRCLCCGDCCESFGGHLQASEHDQQRWRREGRDDLLARVNRLGWIWVDPETKEPLDRCPFIERRGQHRWMQNLRYQAGYLPGLPDPGPRQALSARCVPEMSRCGLLLFPSLQSWRPGL